MVLHNLNINYNIILFADDTSVGISKPSNKTRKCSSSYKKNTFIYQLLHYFMLYNMI